MRRHVAALVVAALMLGVAGPVTAADPAAPGTDAPASLAPSTDPGPTTDPGAAPSAESLPSDVPAANDPVDQAASQPAAPDSSQPAASDPPPATNGAADPTGRWIVLYRAGTDADASSARQAKKGGFHVERTFSHATKGFAAK